VTFFFAHQIPSLKQLAPCLLVEMRSFEVVPRRILALLFSLVSSPLPSRALPVVNATFVAPTAPTSSFPYMVFLPPFPLLHDAVAVPFEAFIRRRVSVCRQREVGPCRLLPFYLSLEGPPCFIFSWPGDDFFFPLSPKLFFL